MDALAVKLQISDWGIVRRDDQLSREVTHENNVNPICFHFGSVGKRQGNKRRGVSVNVSNRALNCDQTDVWSKFREKLESCGIIRWEDVVLGDHIVFRKAEHAGYSVSVKRAETASELEQIFNGLVKNWKEATGGYSVTTRRYAHPSYQAILVLKEDVVPLILRELQQRPDWWFEALRALTKENPVTAGATFEEAVNAWIEWGKRSGRIP
jgi:hypothetical protein